MPSMLRGLLRVGLVLLAGCGCTPATSPADLDDALRMPEAATFIAAESALQVAARQGPSETFMARARDLRRASEAWSARLGDTRDAPPDVQRLADELEGVEVLLGPGLDPARAADPEVRSALASALRLRLFSLREYRHALAPLPREGGSDP